MKFLVTILPRVESDCQSLEGSLVFFLSISYLVLGLLFLLSFGFAI